MIKRPSLYLAIVGVIAAVLLVQKLRTQAPAAPPLKEPNQAPFAESIGARGIVESLQENVRIAPANAGLVSRVLVKVGDRVTGGDALIEQDPRDAKAKVASQEAQVGRLKAQIRVAEVDAADRKDQAERVGRLAQRKVSSEDELQRAQFAVKAAQMRLESARAELESAEAEASRARVQLDLLTTKAPRDGTILQLNIRAGEYAALGSSEPMILLGQIGTLQLRADVDEDNASRVRPDCAAVAFLKGQRANPIALKFVRIEPYIVPKRSLTGESAERVDTRVLQIIFHFQHPETPVYVGQQVDVFIDAGS